MRRLFVTIGLAAAVLTTSAPTAFAGGTALSELRNAQGQPMLQQARYHHRRHYARRGYRSRYACGQSNRRSNREGTVLGAVAGGIGGNVLAGHGNRTLGTVLGAGVGAVAGNQIARARNSC